MIAAMIILIPQRLPFLHLFIEEFNDLLDVSSTSRKRISFTRERRERPRMIALRIFLLKNF